MKKVVGFTILVACLLASYSAPAYAGNANDPAMKDPELTPRQQATLLEFMNMSNSEKVELLQILRRCNNSDSRFSARAKGGEPATASATVAAPRMAIKSSDSKGQADITIIGQ